MKLKITVHGVAYEVEVEVLDAGEGFAPAPLPTMAPVGGSPVAPAPVQGATPLPPAQPAVGAAAAGVVASPLAGVVLELKCAPGQSVKAGDTLLVLEAMKMETNITAAQDATVKAIPVAVGDSVREGQTLVELG